MIKTTDADGIIWVKEVEDYQRFGVVVTDADGNMTKIVEKPTTPISKRANIGLYYIKNWKLLYEGIDHVLKQPKNKGEYYLTDAFQYMIDKGAKIKVDRRRGLVRRGQDRHAARDEPRSMLEKGAARRPKSVEKSVTIIDPVYIEDDVMLVERDDRAERDAGEGQRRRGVHADGHDRRRRSARSSTRRCTTRSSATT